MKRVLLLVVGVVALLVVAPAPAKTVTVDISKLGFVPAAVTVQTGDSVTWTNKDTGNHQVVCAACSPPFTSPVIPPAQTFTTTFTKVGKFTVVDPLNKNKKGTVTVTAAPATVTVAANPKLMNYGNTTTLSGSISTGQTGQKVDILSQPCGENAAKVIGNATTTTGGSFSFQHQSTLTTSYQARFKPATGAAVTSAPISVQVRPIIVLTRNALHKFSIQVVAAQSFVGKAVLFQRWVAARHRWNTVKTVFLGTRAPGTSPLAGSTVSKTSFKANLRKGLRVRAVLPVGQAAPCYLNATSRTARS
jgi:plastocyanin